MCLHTDSCWGSLPISKDELSSNEQRQLCSTLSKVMPWRSVLYGHGRPGNVSLSPRSLPASQIYPLEFAWWKRHVRVSRAIAGQRCSAGPRSMLRHRPTLRRLTRLKVELHWGGGAELVTWFTTSPGLLIVLYTKILSQDTPGWGFFVLLKVLHF